MIIKPSREYKFCLNFRKVNEITKKDLYPTPSMNEILDTSRSAKFISKTDLMSAYLQIPLEQNSKHITAFTVLGKGMIQSKRMPFGLTNAPATFQRLTDKIITPDLKPNLNSAESRYLASEKECLVVVWAMRKFRPYLEGYSFKVITVYMAPKWLHDLKHRTGRLARWALELLEFDHKVIY